MICVESYMWWPSRATGPIRNRPRRAISLRAGPKGRARRGIGPRDLGRLRRGFAGSVADCQAVRWPPKGSIFDIACAWLPDHDLSGLGKEYGLDLSHEAPICQKDASKANPFIAAEMANVVTMAGAA
jgi:hypothetical protein